MQMEAGMAQQPALNRCGLVGAVVVQDQVQFQLAGNRRVNGFKKAFKFGGAMATMELDDYRAGLGVERGKQIDGAVTHVIRAAALGLAGTNRQQRLAAIKRPESGLSHPRTTPAPGRED